MLPHPRGGGALILANVLSHFAEFLKSMSAFTLVFSTCSLVSDWYSSLAVLFDLTAGGGVPPPKRFFLIFWGPKGPPLSSHRCSLFRVY